MQQIDSQLIKKISNYLSSKYAFHIEYSEGAYKLILDQTQSKYSIDMVFGIDLDTNFVACTWHTFKVFLDDLVNKIKQFTRMGEMYGENNPFYGKNLEEIQIMLDLGT